MDSNRASIKIHAHTRTFYVQNWSGSSCFNTCFGVGGDEQVWGVRTESPDGVPAIGDVAHERNSSDRDERKASDGGTGLLNSLAVGQVFLWHGWHCQKFTWRKSKTGRQNVVCEMVQVRPVKWFSLGCPVFCSSSLRWHSWFAFVHYKFQTVQISSRLIVRPTVTVYTSSLVFLYLLLMSLTAASRFPLFFVRLNPKTILPEVPAEAWMLQWL